MIKLKMVEVKHGETTLIFEADGFPEGIREIEIPYSEVVERLKELKRLTGQKPTIQDARNIIKVMVNEMRKRREPFPERFDFTQYIGVDIE